MLENICDDHHDHPNAATKAKETMRMNPGFCGKVGASHIENPKLTIDSRSCGGARRCPIGFWSLGPRLLLTAKHPCNGENRKQQALGWLCLRRYGSLRVKNRQGNWAMGLPQKAILPPPF